MEEIKEQDKKQNLEGIKKDEIEIKNKPIIKDLIPFSKEVLQIQQQLNRINYSKLKEDGLLNLETIKAIKSFKQLMGLNDDKIDNNLKFIINEIISWDGKDNTRTFAKLYNKWKQNNK